MDSRKYSLRNSLRLGRYYLNAKKMYTVPTSELFFKAQELQKLLAIADEASMKFYLPCEISDEELLKASRVAETINRYRQELNERLSVLNLEITKRLESL